MEDSQYDYNNQGNNGYIRYSMPMLDPNHSRQMMMNNQPGMPMQGQFNRQPSLNMQQPRMNMQAASGMSPQQSRMNQYPPNLPHDRSNSTMLGRQDIPMSMNPSGMRTVMRPPYYHAQYSAEDYDDYNDPNMVPMVNGQYQDGRSMTMMRGLQRSNQPFTRASPTLMNNPRGRKFFTAGTTAKASSVPSIQMKQNINSKDTSDITNTISKVKEGDAQIQSILNSSAASIPDINLDPSLTNLTTYDLKGLLTNTNNKLPFSYGVNSADLGHFTSNQTNIRYYTQYPSPWDDKSPSTPSFYVLPRCYNTSKHPLQLLQNFTTDFFDYVDKDSKEQPETIKNLDDITLIYIFYAFPRDLYQLIAAYFLYKRGYFYHKQQQKWYYFKLLSSNNSLNQQFNSILYFDIAEWKFLSSSDVSSSSPEFMTLQELLASINIAKSTYSSQTKE